MSTTPTPRTDDFIRYLTEHEDWLPSTMKAGAFARQLERELQQAQADAAVLRAFVESADCEQDCSSGRGGYVWGKPNGREVPCRRCELLASTSAGKRMQRMEAALVMIRERWTFNNRQQHTHTWHDWADCIVKIEGALAEPKDGGPA
jgi:hypothetical protein